MRVASLIQENGKHAIVLEDRSEPTPKPGEVLVRVRASSLNYHDVSVVRGRLPTRSGIIILSDGAGEIVGRGEGAERFSIGDHVVSTYFPNWINGTATPSSRIGVAGEHVDGFAAQLVAMPQERFVQMPTGYSFRQAATLPCAAVTAWNGLVSTRTIKAGEWVLVQGTGGVSLFALQFAKLLGANVIATSSSDAKLERLKAMGADHVINYKTETDWGKKVFKLTGFPGVAKVIEVGGPGTLNQSIDAVSMGGDIALIGVLTGRTGDVSTLNIMAKNCTITGISVGNRQHQKDAIEAIDTNGLKPVLDKDFDLEDIPEAFEYHASQAHFGKITLSI